MASGGNLLLAESGITPKANTDMALWGIMSPEGCAVFRRPPPSSPKRVAKMKTVLEEGSAIRAVQELRGHNDVKTTLSITAGGGTVYPSIHPDGTRIVVESHSDLIPGSSILAQ